MSARLSANKYLDVAYVFIHEFTCQNFDHEEWAGGGGGRGGSRLFLEFDQKHDREKAKL